MLSESYIKKRKGRVFLLYFSVWMAAFGTAVASDDRQSLCGKIFVELIGVTVSKKNLRDIRVHTKLVSNAGETASIGYRRTNRGFFTADALTQETLEKYYPKAMFSDLIGERVADIGTGVGEFVEECQLGKFGEKIDATGVEVWLDEKQSHKPYYKVGDAANTHLKSDSVTRLFCTISVFSYESTHDPIARAYLVQSLQEFHRILKRGGRARISPANEDKIRALLIGVPGLRVLSAVAMPELSGGMSAVELIKE